MNLFKKLISLQGSQFGYFYFNTISFICAKYHVFRQKYMFCSLQCYICIAQFVYLYPIINKHLQFNTYLMIEQERRVPPTFEGTYKHFTVTLKLINISADLDIQVQNSNTMERYSKVIDHSYIQDNVDFNCLPATDPLTIFQYLAENFNNVIFENGVLKFVYVWGSENFKRESQVKVNLDKHNISPLELAHLRINRLRQEHQRTSFKFENKLLQKDAKIKKLQDRLKRNLRGQKQQRLKSRKKIEQIGERIKRQLQEQIVRNTRAQEEQIQINKIVLEELNERMRRELKEQAQFNIRSHEAERERNMEYNERTRREVENKVRQIQNQNGAIKEKVQKPAISHHPGNTHKVYYNLIYTSTSTRIARQGEIGCYNFVNEVELLPGTKTKYTTKIRKMESNIMIGFCSNSGLGNKNNNASPQSIYYHCSGYFSLSGTYSEFDGCRLGDVVECEADLEMGVVRWRKNGTLLKEFGVPEALVGKGIFFSLIMPNPGDEIEASI